MAARDCDLSETELRLWVLYRSYDSKGKGAFVSDDRIATHMGKAARTVERTRASLIEKGFLKQQLRGPEIARYWAVLPVECSATDGETSSATDGEASANDPPHDPPHDSPLVTPIVRTSTESTDTTPPNPLASGGDWNAFMAVYPERSGEQGWIEAERRWRANIDTGVSAPDMLAGAQRYRGYVLSEDKFGSRWVMKASNWLDPVARRWDTESYHTEPSHLAEFQKRHANLKPVLSDRELAASSPGPIDQGAG